MFIRTFGRLGVAAGVAVALLCATALPASATVHDFDITASSTFDFGTTSFPLGGHATTNACAPNSQNDTLALDLNSTGGGTVSGATAWADMHFGSSTTFEVRLIITAGTVVITGTTITATLSIQLEYASCGSSPLMCRTNVFTLVSSGTNASGSVHPGSSTTATLTGTSTTITTQIGCNLVLRAYLQGYAAVAQWNIHLTT